MATRKSKMMCTRQTLKKYKTRPSPPYSAATCIGRTKKGNDGTRYMSKPGLYAKWVKLTQSSA